MKRSKTEWANLAANKRYLFLYFFSIAFLLFAFYINYNVSKYTDSVSGATVKDLFLDNLPILDINFLFFWAVFIYWVCLLTYHIIHPKETAYIIFGISLLILVRCFFISLTHLGPPENKLIAPEELLFISFNADMFFSGHVGAPFFFALITGSKILRWVSFVYTFAMIIIVLLAHGHYSIDVFGALFIAHSLSVLYKKIRPLLVL